MARLIDANALVDAIKNRIEEDREIYPDFPFTFSKRYSIELDLLKNNQKTLDELKWQIKFLICDDKSSQFKCRIIEPTELTAIQRELMKFTIFNIENSIFKKGR